MRYLLVLAAFIAALALPLLAPAPVNAGDLPRSCPEGYSGPVPIFVYQNGEFPKGKAREAAAQDVNHDELVCYKFRGKNGITFADNIVVYVGP